MANQIPEMLVNFRVYDDGDALLGVADATLPTLEAMTTTVSGAGIAGEVDQPVLGHYASMTLGLNFRTVTDAQLSLASPGAHAIELRGAMQRQDAGTGELTTDALRVAVTVTPKSTALGSMQMASTQDGSGEYEVRRIKIWINGRERVEIDKYNYIARFDGVDFLALVRRQLGIA